MRTVESSVVAATVYRRGALVTREAIVDSDEGGFPDHIRLLGLPLTLDDDSIRVEIATDEGAPPVAGDIRITVAVPTQHTELPPPDDTELEAARLTYATACWARDDLQAALRRLDQLTIGQRGQPEDGKAPARSPTTARLALLELRRTRAAVAAERVAAAEVEVHDAKVRLATLEERRRVASDHRNARSFELRKAAVVRLTHADAATATRCRLRVHYFVTGARWTPAYTFALSAGLDQATVSMRALVGQSTGEDWRDTTLTLSTAEPQRWNELPELKAIRIGRQQPPVKKTGWRPSPSGAEAMYADYDRDLAQPVLPPASMTVVPEPVPESLDDDAAAYGAVKVSVDKAAPKKRSSPPPPAAAPQMQQASAPMPTSIVPMEAEMAPRARSSGLGSLVGSVVGGAVEGVAAAFGGGGEADTFAEDGEAAPPAIAAARGLLDYGALHLHPPDHPHRGRLQRVQTRTLYERLSVESVTTDIMDERITAAQRRSAGFERQTPPTGHHWVQTETGFDYAYVADGPVEVLSDGRLSSLAIVADQADVKPRYVTVPRETQDVFRIVAVRNPLQAPLLPGPADVYVDGKFMLTSDVEVTAPRGRLELGLGVEQGIKVARNVEFEEDTSGLIKRSHELVHTVKVELTNNLARSVRIEVRERVPVPQFENSDVEVEERDVSPAWEAYEQRPDPLEGGRAWDVELAPGVQRTLSAQWLVRVPSQHELIGGNRREQ